MFLSDAWSRTNGVFAFCGDFGSSIGHPVADGNVSLLGRSRQRDLYTDKDGLLEAEGAGLERYRIFGELLIEGGLSKVGRSQHQVGNLFECFLQVENGNGTVCAVRKLIHASHNRLSPSDLILDSLGDLLQFLDVHGPPLFLAANERLGRVVLEADLGLVDLAWRRKQEYTEQMEFLAQEQGRKVGFLKKLLDEASREVE